MNDILYPVNDLYTCVQGEGVQTGVAMALLRLHGCAVGCPWCDTKETWEFEPRYQVDTLAAAQGANPRYVYLSAAAIAEHIRANNPGPKWVLVTGGEPAQYALRPLVTAIHAMGLKAALETSGTEIGHVDAGFDWVCVSPKLNMPGGKVIQPAALAVADEIKHVVGRQKDIDELDELITLALSGPTKLGQVEGAVSLKPDVYICLQPVSVSPRATALCLEVVQQRGWRLSVQMHKYIGVK